MSDLSELTEILICPETRQPLKLASTHELSSLNQRIAQGELKTKSGTVVAHKLEAGLLREDLKVLYQIQNGIPILLAEEAILL